MNLNKDQADELIRTLLLLTGNKGPAAPCEMVLCPPFVHIPLAHQLLDSSFIQVGAQNAYFESQGAYTGEVSAPMLADYCAYVIVGHSERRQLFGETDEMVASKLRAVLGSGMDVILAVGETWPVRQAGESNRYVLSQIKVALQSLEPAQVKRCVIAYEPVWAIGGGKAASVADIGEMVANIRSELGILFGEDGDAVRILYGGSVSAATASDIFGISGLDGALVGGASLDATAFIAIYDALAGSVRLSSGVGEVNRAGAQPA